MFPAHVGSSTQQDDSRDWLFPVESISDNDSDGKLWSLSLFRGTVRLLDLDDNDSRHDDDPVVLRRLSETRGQAVLTFMYLCVLGLCFTTAVVYFCRMQWEERYLRRLREHELGAIRSALAQSEASQREESRAVQRKYIEERRARILQLFVPVRMTLELEHFAIDDEEAHKKEQGKNEAKNVLAPSSNKKDDGTDKETKTNPESELMINTYGDEDSLLVEIPEPGLHLRLAGTNEKPPTRMVSGMCTICLCTFEVGSDVVWSSNELCEHVFHAACAEKWLMRQRDGPLCPCCRRDFIVDPYDLETIDNNHTLQDGDNLNFDAEQIIANNNPSRVQAIFQHGAVDPDDGDDMPA